MRASDPWAVTSARKAGTVCTSAGGLRLSGRRRLCAALCLLVATLVACTGPAPTADLATITFAFPEVDEAYYEPLAHEFGVSHPDITLELMPLDWDLLDELGTESDVILASTFLLSELAEQDVLLSLDALMEPDLAFDVTDYYPGTLAMLSQDGETWAIPAGMDLLVMYYSQDLLGQSGVSHPAPGWTWDDFLASTLAVNDPPGGVYGYITTPEHFDAVLFIYQHGGRVVDDPLSPTRTTFDDPLTIEALEWYARLFGEYDVAPTRTEALMAFGGGRYAVYRGLSNGKVGLWVGDFSDRGGLNWSVEWYVNWGMGVLPADVQPATSAWVEAYAIFAETRYPDACWQWVRFLSDRATFRLMPPRRSLVASKEYELLVGKEVAAVVRASADQALFFSPRVWLHMGEAMDLFEEAVDQIIEGEATPDEAMAWAQREAEVGSVPE